MHRTQYFTHYREQSLFFNTQNGVSFWGAYLVSQTPLIPLGTSICQTPLLHAPFLLEILNMPLTLPNSCSLKSLSIQAINVQL